MCLVKLARFLTCCTRIPYVTTSSSDCPIVFIQDMRACKCHSFSDEGSRRLPKCLNYCFNVLASATNRSIVEEANNDGALMYLAVVICTGIPCAPYASWKDLVCAVCTNYVEYIHSHKHNTNKTV